jgi:adapter protein MecA 1/2
MKIEKINDRQIRCTISKSDLTERKIKLSELACGTGNSKQLFRDMIRQASEDFGFEADEAPLMIEAIPVSSESIVLIVTKVPYPEELDPRFSRLSEGDTLTAPDDDYYGDDSDYEDDEYDYTPPSKTSIPKINYENSANDIVKICDSKDSESSKNRISKIYRFQSLEDIIRVAHIAGDGFEGLSTLIKAPDGSYDLIVENGKSSLKDFNRFSNILSEYGSALKDIRGMESHMREQYTIILKEDALASLSKL